MAKTFEDDEHSPFLAGLEEDSDSSTVPNARREDPREKGGERRPRRRRRAPNSGDLFFLLAIFVVVLLFFLVSFRDLASLLYSREAGIVLLVVVIQYLVLKSMDRTRVYQMENQRLRDLRRADRLLLRRARDIIEDHLADATPPILEEEEESEDKSRWRTRAEEIVKDIADSI